MKQLNKEIIKVIKYFSFFAYYPTLDEIHTFLQVKIDKKRLKYTPPQYSIKEIKNLEFRIKNSKKKLNNLRFRLYIRLISLFPQIKLIGLSGSISMMNAKADDDIDLFIITAKNRLFTGRLIALILAQLLGLRRRRTSEKLDTLFSTATPQRGLLAIVSKKASSLLTNPQPLIPNPFKNKVCLNLFFDESNLKVPKFKQTLFVGHEVLQMKPIVVKENIYQRFLEVNEWVFRLFPNAREVVSRKYKVLSIKQKKSLNTYYLILNTFFNKIEQSLKGYQLHLINCHRTTELITPTQLWFHPDDFEKKLKAVKNGYKLL